MRHRVHGRKLGRTSPHRRALLRNLCTSLFEYERVTTTVQKAKEVRPIAERMITLGKKETLHARRQAAGFLLKATVVKKLFDNIAARFTDRSGGYTRIFKLGPRSGDGAELAIIELITEESQSEDKSKQSSTKTKSKPSKEKPKTKPPKASEDKPKQSSTKTKSKPSKEKPKIKPPKVSEDKPKQSSTKTKSKPSKEKPKTKPPKVTEGK